MRFNWILTFLILTLFTSAPTLARECTLEGSPTDLLKQINHADDVVDIDSVPNNSKYLSCVFRVEPQLLTPMQKDIKEAYYTLLERDTLYQGALEYDEALW